MTTFVVGDVHGHGERLAALLRDAGLVDRRLSWSGADARLWLMGDLVDRGPDGIGAIDLVMRLQQEGDVRCLLGNHEAGLISVLRFAREDCGVPGVTFQAIWEMNGGMASDLERLRPEHVAWIERLPAVARDGDWLLIHSDTDRYLEYGDSTDSICSAVSALVAEGDATAFARLLEDLADRGAFADHARLRRVLAALGGERVIHGHTPIWYAEGTDPGGVREPLEYAGGRAINVDHCLYAGGSGFVVELSEDGTKLARSRPTLGRRLGL
jgi:Calcineurin-like phosphoesterase